MSGCMNGIKNSETVCENRDFGITLEQFNCSWKLPDEEKIIVIADDILAGNIVVLDTMEPLHCGMVESLDWNVQYTDTPNTFQLYLQSLNSIVYLTSAYEISGNSEYLEYAEKFIRIWNDYKNSEVADSNIFVWYDHGTALRAENLIYYALVANTNGYLSNDMYELIVTLIKEHEDFLADEKNYTKNHNHGIFQDRALIYCSYFLENDKSGEYLELAKSRLEAQKNYAFTEDMVHVENSPGYQVGVMDLFRIIANFLIQFDDDFGENLYKDTINAAEFMAYVTKPNGIVAEIGDTNSSVSGSTITSARMEVFDNPHLTYASTQGKSGKKPEEMSRCWLNSGYYISHNSWENEEYEMSTWQLFKSGYSSKTHKHADDNSFMLYSKGYDVFVDPGWYSYMVGDRYRDYFVSALAHNTVVVDGKTYSPTEENSSKVGFYEYEKEAHYDYVCGYNEMYDGVSYDRHYYNLGDSIIIWDDINSSEKHTYTQLFHASEYMNLVSQNDIETVFELADTGYFIRIKQLSSLGKNSIVAGDFGKEKFGYISREMGHLGSINTVKYDVVGSNVDIITLITIENGQGDIQNLADIQYDEILKNFQIKSTSGEVFQIELKERCRVADEKIIVKQKDENTFIFENNNVGIYETSAENFVCAWYVIDKNSAEVSYKTEYSHNNSFEYKFEVPGDYLIKAYTKSQNNRYRCSRIVAAISYDSEKMQFENVTDRFPFLNLKYNGQEMRRIGEKSYQFMVDYNYSWNSNIRWYIYRNGGYFTSFLTNNENEIEYNFEKPGKYTVIYYLSTPNGDNEYWNFPEIEIR